MHVSSIAAMTPRKNLLDRLSDAPHSSTQSRSGSRSRLSSSSSSPVSTPTPRGLFAKLKHQQSRCQNNITTYIAGELQVVEYPLTPGGTRAKPSLVWSILKTYSMPQLYCFHEEKACTHPIGHGLLYVAECGQRKGKCGYYVNFNLVHQNQDGPAKLYRPNQIVEAAVDSTNDGPGRDEFAAPESTYFSENISTVNVTPPSSGPVRTPRHRQANISTAWVTPRSTQRSKKARIAERVPSSHQELDSIPPAPDLTFALAPTTTLQESMSRDYSQPPYTQADPVNSTYHAEIFHSIHEIMLDLESPQGLKKALFWFYFKECEDCGAIARADVHVCPIQENPFDNADEVDSAAIGDGYEADAESSPVRGKKMPVIDLTLDDSD